MSQRELARTLKLSPGTVNHHLRSLGQAVVVSRSPVRIDSDALEQLAGDTPAPTRPPVGTQSSTRSVRVDPSLSMGPADLRAAAAIAQELCDTLTHAAVLAEQLAQMGFDVPGTALHDRATLRNETRDGMRDADRTPSRTPDSSDHHRSGSGTPACGDDWPVQSGKDGARGLRDELRDVAHDEYTHVEGISPGQDLSSGSGAVREPRDAARGSSFEERKKDLLSFSSSNRATASRDIEQTSRTTMSSRIEVREAIAPLIEQCKKCSKPYSIDDNGISILQTVPVEGLEHAVQQICRQIRTDPQNNVRTPLGMLVAKAKRGDEIFTITEPAPTPAATPPAPKVSRRVQDEITLDDMWSQLTDDQRTTIESQVSTRHGPMMVVGQKRMLAAEILGIDLDDSSAA